MSTADLIGFVLTGAVTAMAIIGIRFDRPMWFAWTMLLIVVTGDIYCVTEWFLDNDGRWLLSTALTTAVFGWMFLDLRRRFR